MLMLLSGVAVCNLGVSGVLRYGDFGLPVRVIIVYVFVVVPIDYLAGVP